jgi:hypothetical protein
VTGTFVLPVVDDARDAPAPPRKGLKLGDPRTKPVGELVANSFCLLQGVAELATLHD